MALSLEEQAEEIATEIVSSGDTLETTDIVIPKKVRPLVAELLSTDTRDRYVDSDDEYSPADYDLLNSAGLR